MTSNNKTNDIPYFALGNTEPIPDNLPEELKTLLSAGRREAGYDDNGNKTPDSVDVAHGNVNMIGDSELQAILEELHERVAMSWIKNDRQTHSMLTHTNGDSCVTEAITALHKWRRDTCLARVPEKKTLKTDTPLDDEDGDKFCVECGQFEFEGKLYCQCVGFNEAIDQMKQAISEGE